jgi:hypothetical protein
MGDGKATAGRADERPGDAEVVPGEELEPAPTDKSWIEMEDVRGGENLPDLDHR